MDDQHKHSRLSRWSKADRTAPITFDWHETTLRFEKEVLGFELAEYFMNILVKVIIAGLGLLRFGLTMLIMSARRIFGWD